MESATETSCTFCQKHQHRRGLIGSGFAPLCAVLIVLVSKAIQELCKHLNNNGLCTNDRYKKSDLLLSASDRRERSGRSKFSEQYSLVGYCLMASSIYNNWIVIKYSLGEHSH